ncbi:Tripartite motif-containing protein 16 [Anabarilius grahami]|uniref:Tripartite motif-containing protein 16 n=1 Tax=Anabarilius grahami TaxID=495550 RepID=A0A3N0XZU3_ANAGA|nr:Tripartite motif-containing protein 16 [Anabarilius grahami]
MAEASISVDQDQFTCPVCLDLLKDPVTIPCGHSYCMSCITDCWNQEDQKGIYRCPLCKQTFTPRPVLGKNVVIAEMVEKLKKTGHQSAAPAVPHSGSGDVQCDSCTGRKQKAVKSCLECRSSYCQNHLEQHENLFSKRHNLMDATGRLQDMICPQHDKMLEIYCRTDQRCICMLCLVDEHKYHDTVSTAAARKEKQRHFEEKQRNIQKRIQQKEKDLQQLREAVASHKRSAQTAVEDSERIFTELIRSIERRRSEVIQLIRDQERAAVSRAEERLERLEQEINDLRRRDAEMKQLSQTQDHVHFLQSLPSLSLSGSADGFTVSSHLSFDEVVKSVSQLRDKLLQFCSEETEIISGRVKTVLVILAPEYQTREEFLKYSHLLTLDPNSVHKWLSLSEGNTVITATDTDQHYPDHPNRFDYWMVALCRESVTGRCYWEVEWSGDGRSAVGIAVTYKSIGRKGQEPEVLAGCNDQSWKMFCSPSKCSFWHNNIETVLPVVNVSSRIGVYVDHSAGILSFYSVSDTMSLIHRVQTTFTQPLYAVFGLDKPSRVKLCRLTNHSFCKECLQQFWRSNNTQECPVCRKRSSRDEPPCNLVLKNLCESFLKERNKRHSSGSEEICSLHSEKLKLFCLEDKQPVCLVCRDSQQHDNHKFRPISEAVSSSKEELNKALKSLQEKIQHNEKMKGEFEKTVQHIKSQAEHTDRQIKQQFGKLHQFLRDEEEATITALREEEEQKKQMMKEKLEEMNRHISALSHTMKDMEEMMKANDICFLKKFPASMERVQISQPDPQMASGVLIHVPRYLGNLQLKVWKKMQDIVQNSESAGDL